MTTILRADRMLTPDGEVQNAELEIDERGRIAYAGPARAESVVTHDLAGHAPARQACPARSRWPP